jgi:outer membrane protein TolC
LTASRDAGGDALPERARVQGEQQRVVALKATLMKQKLALAQALGLPRGQPFTLSDQMSYAPLRQMTLDDALGRAYRGRADFQAQLARVEAAEAKRRSASSERLPTVHIRADIGKIGQEPPSAKKTFGLQGILHVPIMGGATRGNVLEADAELRQEKAKLEDLRDAIYYQIQNALIDVQAAEEEVRLARGAVQLADEQLARSTDRGVVTAGAATTPRNVIDRAGAVEPRQGGDSGDTLQAQDAATAANANYISSLYTFNAAKLTFAQAIGVAEAAYMQFLAGTF